MTEVRRISSGDGLAFADIPGCVMKTCATASIRLGEGDAAPPMDGLELRGRILIVTDAYVVAACYGLMARIPLDPASVAPPCMGDHARVWVSPEEAHGADTRLRKRRAVGRLHDPL